MRSKILFLGASITQGKVSKSYVKMLKAALGTKQYDYINHGIAGYESYNVLKKLNKAVKIKPDYVIILIGTNDVLSSLDPRLAEISRKLKKIPHEPMLSYYSNNIKSIIRQLKQETNSKIAVVSLPVVGEDLETKENKTIEKYNTEIKAICENEDVVYLPVFEKQTNFLIQKNGGKGKKYIKGSKMAFKAMFLHFLLFMSFDAISSKNGYLLLTDGIHQNTIGARFIADEIENFIHKLT